MKIIEGKKQIVSTSRTVDLDGLITDETSYYQIPDKKVLEREDRFIVTKRNHLLTHTNHLFMVTTVGLDRHNIISVEHGNTYFSEDFETIEELSEGITKVFGDFNVIEPCMDLPIKDLF